jgi:ABC-type nitrate/sulfonate/bicarbonate transport system substrate-binding protein
MALIPITVMYGHLEGNAGNFAREPSGLLAIDAGIFAHHGLDVSWTHVQGTEERYRRLEDGRAQISLVVGRASLSHFLSSKTTRILGCAMNSCPYYLVADSKIDGLSGLKGKTIACREAPSRNTPLNATLERLGAGHDVKLELTASDENAFQLAVNGSVAAAILPRPFGFWAEERGLTRISAWPAIVDDPMPITIETTERLLRERSDDLARFVAVHRESIRYLKSNREEALKMLQGKFGHSPTFAAKTFDEYFVCLNDRLTVDLRKLAQLLAQVNPGTTADARSIAREWIAEGALAAAAE